MRGREVSKVFSWLPCTQTALAAALARVQAPTQRFCCTRRRRERARRRRAEVARFIPFLAFPDARNVAACQLAVAKAQASQRAHVSSRDACNGAR
jgi:hypothetical protein